MIDARKLTFFIIDAKFEFFKFYENPIEYDKNTHKEIIKFDLIKINGFDVFGIKTTSNGLVGV